MDRVPDNARETPRDFAHYAPPEIVREGLSARVFLGTLLGSTSPVTTFTPLVGAEITLAPGSRIDLDVDPAYEHGILVDLGEVVVDTTPVPRRELAYVGIGTDVIPLSNPGDEPARIMLLGGQPFGEEILMWWNFVGRTHEEIVGYRTEWENHSERFGQVQGYEGPVQHLPAPPLPHTRLRTRVNPPPRVDD
ncbi:hypothetical protein GCM10027169_23240 [Gordonia jinhuaensis]|uniref:Pirin C-terminal domain-containing protein n=1 Tax=Gordonia jinhuaensis TaxID=1517702 RepID=A0A916TEW3_9ACTN|nr:hypothetical protein GCM10011489_30700 [Gordonia jinhuaensis]